MGDRRGLSQTATKGHFSIVSGSVSSSDEGEEENDNRKVQLSMATSGKNKRVDDEDDESPESTMTSDYHQPKPTTTNRIPYQKQPRGGLTSYKLFFYDPDYLGYWLARLKCMEWIRWFFVRFGFFIFLMVDWFSAFVRRSNINEFFALAIVMLLFAIWDLVIMLSFHLGLDYDFKRYRALELTFKNHLKTSGQTDSTSDRQSTKRKWWETSQKRKWHAVHLYKPPYMYHELFFNAGFDLVAHSIFFGMFWWMYTQFQDNTFADLFLNSFTFISYPALPKILLVYTEYVVMRAVVLAYTIVFMIKGLELLTRRAHPCQYQQ